METGRLVSDDLYLHSRAHIDESVSEVFTKAKYGTSNYELSIALRKNASQFSAHKAAYFTDWMKGKTKEEKKAILSTYEQQLTVEGNLSSRAGRSAKIWEGYLNDKEQYPNIEYLPSRSADKRDSHKKYYGLILPIDHDFWRTGLAPNDWGCKCRSRQTDAPATSAISPPKSKKGIPGNAGMEKAVFAKDHPFFTTLNKNGIEQVQKEWSRLERKRTLTWAKEKLTGKKFKDTNGTDIMINQTGVRELVNQPHKNRWERDQLLLSLKDVIKKSKPFKSVDFDPQKKGADMFTKVHYYEVRVSESTSYLVVRERVTGERILYSIVDKVK